MNKKLNNKKILIYDGGNKLIEYKEFNALGNIIHNTNFILNTNIDIEYNKNNLIKKKTTYNLVDTDLYPITEKYYYDSLLMKRREYEDNNKNIKNVFNYTENGFISSIDNYDKNKLVSSFKFNKIVENTYEATNNNIKQIFVYYHKSNNIKQKIIDNCHNKSLICYNKSGDYILSQTTFTDFKNVEKIKYFKNGLIKSIKNKVINNCNNKITKNTKEKFRYEIINNIDDEINKTHCQYLKKILFITI